MLLCLCLTAAASATAAQPLSQEASAAASPSVSPAEPTAALAPGESVSESSAAPEAQLLDADELAELAERSEEPGHEVGGGGLNNLHKTLIAIAIAFGVVVLIGGH